MRLPKGVGSAIPLRQYLSRTGMTKSSMGRAVGLSHVAIHYMLERDARDIWVVETRQGLVLYEWKHIAGGVK